MPTVSRVLKCAVVLLVAMAGVTPEPARAQECETYRITGYVRGHHSPHTFDGTSVWTEEPVAAASWNVPIGAKVEIDGVGTFRVADRGGGLGPRHVDVLVNSVAEAYALTDWRVVCVTMS